MILLDTNVVSEAMKLDPDVRFRSWLSGQHPDDLYLTSITVAELLLGVNMAPLGRRRDDLEVRVRRTIAAFGPVVLAFDAPAAAAYAQLAVGREAIDTFDMQIAAIARVHGAAVATRNLRHFRDLSIDLINPWDA